ncbi:MAG: ATP-grasp domain-containing protein, partial [Bacillota bacterium]
MSIGILYESHEWSSTALRKYIAQQEIQVELIDLETEVDIDKILEYDLIVNRVFASAQFRGHQKSLEVVEDILDAAKARDIEVINSYEAHFYEISKYRTTNKLADLGFSVPEIYEYFHSCEEPDYKKLNYPCVLKPDCGGRSRHTHILESELELKSALSEVQECNFDFIIQEYVPTTEGYITRIEIIGGEHHSTLKRYVVEGGLSAYQLGSEYDNYPDCALEIIDTSIAVLDKLNMELGSLDIIESEDDFYIIDVNSVSNFAPENIEMFGFNLIKDKADYIVKRYQELVKSKSSEE